MLAFLITVNGLFWLLTWQASYRFPTLIASGLLAYGFGLRHAGDADHISAIDNATRRLMQQGKRPVSVGFFFSLGHSTVVVLLCIALTLSASYFQTHLAQWKGAIGAVGTVTSSAFLYTIGAINLVVLWDVYKRYQACDADLAAGGQTPETQGLMARLLRPILRLIRRPWQMYFVGFLFGLGFDTATEIGLLAMSARSGQQGIPLDIVLLLPALFTAGMSLIDTLDGILMLGAYGWAFVQPQRKFIYNMGITLLSVLVAFVVGTYELLQIIKDRFSLRGGPWQILERLPFASLGFAIVGAFALMWGVDNELVIGAEEEIFEMNNGCICCTVRGDLIRILGNLMKRRDKFDYVMIETTGMADPGPVAQTVFMDHEMQSQMQLDGVVTLVDAKHVWQHIEDSDEVKEQIAFADVILLNKIDLVTPEELEKLEARIHSMNAAARIYRTRDAAVEMDSVLNIGGFNLSRALEVDPKFMEPEYPFEAGSYYALAKGT